jgi:hypothetical protein
MKTDAAHVRFQVYIKAYNPIWQTGTALALVLAKDVAMQSAVRRQTETTCIISCYSKPVFPCI